MKGMVFAAIGALTLAGCTGAHIKKPEVCDGKHRRPANLYGSILPTLPVPVPASQAAAQSMVVPGPAPGPQPLPPPPPPSAVTPAPVFPAPDNSESPGQPTNGAAASPTPPPRTSLRIDARSYLSC